MIKNFLSKRWKALFASVLVALIIAIILCNIFLSPLLAEQAGEKTGFFTALFKDAPGISAKPTVEYDNDHSRIYLGCDFTANCKDNYKEVVILLELEDHNGVIYKREYITFANCKEGNKYSQTYTLSTEEILKTGDLHYELYKYK